MFTSKWKHSQLSLNWLDLTAIYGQCRYQGYILLCANSSRRPEIFKIHV